FVLSDTRPEKALDICTMAVNALRKIKLLENMGGSIKQITSSMGIASFPVHADTLETLKEITDQALYQAKDLGRNRAVLYSPQREL
ncbi:MAG TPA: diguanylate cyclase, partial [Spirochaetales bacterium]|nr:diguanylate cyclase [Spirochaetales bacterium]